jgi:hypothetical protein
VPSAEALHCPESRGGAPAGSGLSPAALGWRCRCCSLGCRANAAHASSPEPVCCPAAAHHGCVIIHHRHSSTAAQISLHATPSVPHAHALPCPAITSLTCLCVVPTTSSPSHVGAGKIQTGNAAHPLRLNNGPSATASCEHSPGDGALTSTTIPWPRKSTEDIQQR